MEEAESEVPYGQRKFDRMYDGTLVNGTDEQLRAEYDEVFERLVKRGGMDRLRDSMLMLSEVYRKSRHDGECKKAVVRLAGML